MPRGRGAGEKPRGGAGDTPRGGAGATPCRLVGESTRGSKGLSKGASPTALAGDRPAMSPGSGRRGSGTPPLGLPPTGSSTGSGRGSPSIRTGGEAATELWGDKDRRRILDGRGGSAGSSAPTVPTTSTHRALKSRRKSGPPPPPAGAPPSARPSPPPRSVRVPSGLRERDRTGECETALPAAARGGGGPPNDGGRGGLRRVLRRLGDSGDVPRMVDRDGCSGWGGGRVVRTDGERGNQQAPSQTTHKQQGQGRVRCESAVSRQHQRRRTDAKAHETVDVHVLNPKTAAPPTQQAAPTQQHKHKRFARAPTTADSTAAARTAHVP